MILDYNDTNFGELLAHISEYEQNPSWSENAEDLSDYHDSLEVVWEILVKTNTYNPLRAGIYHRLNYFKLCANASIDNMKLYIKQNTDNELCKLICN